MERFMAWGSKRIQFFIAAYVAALVVLASVGYFYADYTIKADRQEKVLNQRFRSDVAYVNLPRMNLTLPAVDDSHQSGRVRLEISLAVEKKYAGRIEDLQPRITDRLVTYIRTLNFDSLSEPKATLWLHQRLLEEATSASTPLPIVDVIFEKFVIL
jgi:flagellar basal body-associated protein FliL